MDAHYKAIAALISTLVVALLRPHFPDLVADPTLQATLEAGIDAIIVVGSVWLAPRAPAKEKTNDPV